MVSKKEAAETVAMGKSALNWGTNDVGYLRFLINRLTYNLDTINKKRRNK